MSSLEHELLPTTMHEEPNFMRFKHDINSMIKNQQRSLNVEIDLYPYATELYSELEKIGIIERIKEIPQLGAIKVTKSLSKNRFDYVVLQLYLHKLIKTKLQDNLRYTYNNKILSDEFFKVKNYPDKKHLPSLGDILQLLIIVYNIGHFYNTFTSSRAITMLAKEDNTFHHIIVNANEDMRYQNAAKSILEQRSYHKLHILNSILVLEKCKKSNKSISIALEILYSYLNEESLPEESKLKYVFSLFKHVRIVSYLAYDLQLAKIPVIFDLCNEKAMQTFLKELVSKYNNNQSSYDLINSINKMLNDTIYNECSDVICYYKISRRMVNILKNSIGNQNINYYEDLFINKSSVLNIKHSNRMDHIKQQLLKLTFAAKDRNLSECLLSDVEKLNNTRVGYYDRQSGEQTVIISLKENCDAQTKRYTALKTLQSIIYYVRKISNISNNDTKFLLAVKFFLFYLFDEHPIEIKPNLGDICVVCTRGRNKRVKEIRSLLTSYETKEDTKHEVEFLLDRIKHDNINDTTITIPSSIIVYHKDKVGFKLCEFDGLIIHPLRKTKQIMFLEAKNRDHKPSFAKKCLIEKFNNFSIKPKTEEIETIGYDAAWTFTV